MRSLRSGRPAFWWPPMLPFASAHLPGTGGVLSPSPEDFGCEEILVRQPGGAGGYLWAKAVKTGIGTSQARAAVARAVGIDVDQVGTAGNRDRRARCVQWFSVPEKNLENPGALRNAGHRGGLKVVDVQTARGPIGPDSVAELRWSLRLRGAAKGDGWPRAKLILAHLRNVGLPNYVHPARLGKDGQLAKWGRLLIGGGRLPPAVARTGVAAGECLGALQWSLFNRWLAARVADGMLATCLAGERVRTGVGDEVVVDDPATWQKRLDAWEAVALGPLYGDGMTATAADAAAREAAALADSGLAAGDVARLRGDRRAARAQPRKVVLDREGEDLLVVCELPASTYALLLAEELAKPERPFA